MTEIRVPCGCTIAVDHEVGERLVTCGGGTLYDLDARGTVFCPGGRPYVVTAQRGPTVYVAQGPTPAVRARLEAHGASGS